MTPNPTEIALRAQLRAAQSRINDLEQQVATLRSTETDRLRALQDRLTDMQAANEGAYRQQYDATGGPRFDPLQPFGQHAAWQFIHRTTDITQGE